MFTKIKKDYSENEYPILIKQIMIFIDDIKKQKLTSDLSLIDIIMEFAFRNDINVQLIGDAISSDIYFKSFIEKDCEIHNFFSNKNHQMDETW
jgi:hypothetical protein